MSSTPTDGSTPPRAVPAQPPLAVPGPAPTWRDLPAQPPYGPVPPPRTPGIGGRSAEVGAPAHPDPTFSPGQIALAVGTTLLLVAVGIGAALFLLDRGEDDVAVETSPPPAVAPSEDPMGSTPTEDLPGPTAAPLPSGPPATEEVPDLPLDIPTDDGPMPSSPAPQAPDGPALPAPERTPPAQATEEGVDLPRMFALRTLPSGTAETSTTVRRTSRDDEVVEEQVTALDITDGEAAGREITVRATRDADAAARLDALITDDAQELTVRGLPAYLVEPGHLVWLVPGDPETLLEIVAPAEVGTDQLLTLGNGLEVLR